VTANLSTGCNNCQDLGYTTRRGGRWAEAALCECGSPCPACQDEGRVIDRDDQGRTWVKPCECVSRRKRIAQFNRARVPAAYHDKNVEYPSFQPATRSQADAQRWLTQFQQRRGAGDRGILMMGPPGVGKTHLLCGIIRFLVLERGLECRYVDSFQLLQELKIAFDAGSGSTTLMDDIASVSILALDELGKTRTTGWQREVLDQIVSRRYDQGLTTFLTSNYNLPDEGGGLDGSKFSRDSLCDRVGPRIFSRLMEMCRTFELDGDDVRLA